MTIINIETPSLCLIHSFYHFVDSSALLRTSHQIPLQETHMEDSSFASHGFVGNAVEHNRAKTLGSPSQTDIWTALPVILSDSYTPT